MVEGLILSYKRSCLTQLRKDHILRLILFETVLLTIKLSTQPSKEEYNTLGIDLNKPLEQRSSLPSCRSKGLPYTRHYESKSTQTIGTVDRAFQLWNLQFLTQKLEILSATI